MIIHLDYIATGLALEIKGGIDDTLKEISDTDVMLFAEAKYQLKEGCFYEYEFNKPGYGFIAGNKNTIVTPSGFCKTFDKNQRGIIQPNIYVGTHHLEIFDAARNCLGVLPLEVRSVKSEYRTDYRFMLESIAEKCTDLVMQIDAPALQHFETDFNKDSETLYQRFAFVKSLVDSKEFEEAVHKIISAPTTKWQTESEERDIRAIKKFSSKSVRQLITANNRIPVSKEHILHRQYGIKSVPAKIQNTRKTESTDTAENRFVKHALQEFLLFCENCEAVFQKKYQTATAEAAALSMKLSGLLNQGFFKDISRPASLKLNSPALQRKSGYREVLNSWLKFDLAARLVWSGGDNVYGAGKKDVATLYEYWLFFTLLDLLKDIFSIEPKSINQLIQFDNGRLSLSLKQGTAIALKGIYKSSSRNLNIQFSYNRSFGGGKKYPLGGSYTTTLRPDYTLSIWPEEIAKPDDAELRELITHIHFDAKYKVNNFYELVKATETEEELNEDKTEERKGTFKNADLLKMHAYKDAIRRTAGAYVLYPGVGKNDPFRGFHELIPGLGAFVIKPEKNDDNDKALKSFILKVVDNFIDRASQRENTSVKLYEIHKEEKMDDNVLHEPIPEYLNDKKLIPDETFVLVGYATTSERFKWYEENEKYIFRMDEEMGSLELNNEVVGAKYLLLRRNGETKASDLYEIKSKGPKVFSKAHLDKLNYPTSKKPKDYYLAIEIEKVAAPEFQNVSWNFKELEEYRKMQQTVRNPYSQAGMPFTISLTKLMKVKVGI